MPLTTSKLKLTVVLFLFQLGTACTRTSEHSTAPAPSATLEDQFISRFTTFNTALADSHSPYYEVRRQMIINDLKNLDTDLICLQEVWDPQDAEDIISSVKPRFPYTFYAKTWNLFKWRFGRNGLLLLSRGPLRNATYQPLESFLVTRGVITADVNLRREESTTIGCTHLSTTVGKFPPYLGRYDSWDAEQEQQAQTIAAIPGISLVMGDMNSSPSVAGTDIKAFMETGYQAFLKNGFVSPYIVNQTPTCTWCADNVVAGNEWGNLIIDHIFIQQKLQGRVVGVKRVLDDKAPVNDGKTNSIIPMPLSDHYGITLSF